MTGGVGDTGLRSFDRHPLMINVLSVNVAIVLMTFILSSLVPRKNGTFTSPEQRQVDDVRTVDDPVQQGFHARHNGRKANQRDDDCGLSLYV